MMEPIYFYFKETPQIANLHLIFQIQSWYVQ